MKAETGIASVSQVSELEDKDPVLELGAGKDSFSDNPVRLDLHYYSGTDIVFDLESLGEGRQLPFPDESFDVVRAKQVLEHIDDLLPVFEEVYRVLESGGRFEVEVPHAESPNAFSDPTHKRFFTCETFQYFAENMDTGILEEQLSSSWQLESVETIYNYEIGFAPHPLRFWKPEAVKAVFVKEERVHQPVVADNLVSSLAMNFTDLTGELWSRIYSSQRRVRGLPGPATCRNCGSRITRGSPGFASKKGLTPLVVWTCPNSCGSEFYPESFKQEVSSLGEDFRGRHVIGDVEVVSR